ncbi:MAG: DUF6703 family protein [Terracoccus sp.]
MPPRLSARTDCSRHASRDRPSPSRAWPRLSDVPLGFRSRVEHASAPLAARLNAAPRPLALGVLVVVLAIGIVAPSPWSGIAFLLVALFVGWLLFLTWQRLTLPERLMRLAVLVLALAVAVVEIVPRG